MTNQEFKVGQKVEFTPTSNIFEIAKITRQRISWYNNQITKSSYGKNNISMSWITIKQFIVGLEKGTYKLI